MRRTQQDPHLDPRGRNARPTVHPFPALLLLLCAACSAPEDRESAAPDRDEGLRQDPRAGLAPGRHLRPGTDADGRRGALVLSGQHGVTLDLEGVTLLGAEEGTDLDRSAGYGIVIEDCTDVTVKGGRLGGYRGCVVVRDSERVTVEDVEFEGWYAQRLRSNVAAEDPSDWLRPHDNDQGEWLARYGAAISFTDCEDVTVRRCRGRRGQNGVLLTRTERGEVYDNDFCFLSGWGIALYRTSDTTISRNLVDYCVRGYSHGVYSRGQDSAGILLFEGSSDNVVAFNSATHSGDGVFLFAGRDLVDGRGSGDVGGCDRNLFYGNDLRYSPANGLEATFSNRNLVVRNDLSGCAQHGVWGGYSSDLLVLDNLIADCVEAGITVEHGQDCVFTGNELRRNNIGIELYWDPDPEFVDGPYGERRDTDSRDAWILGNRFENNTQDLVVRETSGVTLYDNDWDGGRRPYVESLRAADGVQVEPEAVLLWAADRDGDLPSGHISKSSLRDWTGRGPDLVQELGRITAPQVPGRQSVRAEDRGVETGDRSTIVMGEWGPWDYRGGEPRPSPRLPGGVLREARWRAQWFRWSDDVDPRADLEAWRALAAEPLVEKTVGSWLHPWADDDVRAVVGSSHFGLVASTRLFLEGGRYFLSVTSDDGVRVRIDGEEVFADWTWHAPRRGEAELELSRGEHDVELEYFQIDGAAALIVELEKR